MSQATALGAVLISVPLFPQAEAGPLLDRSGSGAPLAYHEIVAKARPSADLLATEALLADSRRALAATQGRLREGVSLGAATGPRRGSRGAVTADQAVDLDLPLFLDSPTRRAAEEALGRSAEGLRAAARLELARRLRQAYLDAWLERRILALRTLDLATVEAWLEAASARFAAGADPAFQVSLVEGETLKARLEVEESRQRATAAWGELRALADLPAEPPQLADPGSPVVPTRPDLEAQYASGTVRSALLARLELEEESVRLRDSVALSRWGLRAGLAREGDETFGRVGVIVRLNRPGELEALRQASDAELAAARRATELALADLDARFEVARERLASQGPLVGPESFTAAIQAVGLRLREGKERPSEALPIRRQLLEAQIVALRRLHAAHLVAAELELLTAGVLP
jgi:outer membrane protein TolC